MRVLPLLLLGALSCGVPQGDGLNIPDGFIQRVGGDPTASGSRLKLQILAGDDGSRQPAGFWDTKLNSTCAAFRDESGDLRCFPSVAQTFYYSDPACKEPLFPATDCPTPPPFGVESIQRQGCGSFAFYRAYKINSAIVKPTTVYYGPFGTCIATAATPDAKYWTSTRVPDTDFVLMTMKTRAPRCMTVVLTLFVAGHAGAAPEEDLRRVGEQKARDQRRAFLKEHRADIIPPLSALRCAQAKALSFVERTNRSYRRIGEVFDDEKPHRAALQETDAELAFLRATPLPCGSQKIRLLIHCLKSVEDMNIVVGAPFGGEWCYQEPYATWARLDQWTPTAERVFSKNWHDHHSNLST